MVQRAPILLAAASLAAAACTGTIVTSESASACPGLRTAALGARTQCGATLDFTPINSYQGDLPVVQAVEDAVVLIDGDCTGTLIAAAAGPIVLTAGHCVGLGNVSLLAFNVEANPDGDQLVTNGTVIEQSLQPDYALIRLDQLPAVTPTLLTTRLSDLLAVIQHPRGGPKVVAEGSFAAACNDMIFYRSLDTLVGSSGAGVLTQDGFVVGVHTDGDCAIDGSGFNFGWTSASIVAASSYLSDADIGDR